MGRSVPGKIDKPISQSGAINTVLRVHRLGRAMHPDLSLNSIKHQVILLAQCIIHLPKIRSWFDISDNPLLTGALNRFPLISGAIYWPYMNHKWERDRRLKTIEQHYRMIDEGAAILKHATFEEVEIVRLDEEYPGLRIVLDKASWFLREGEIVLNLFVNDQRCYSVAFTLGMHEGKKIIWVGAIQGSNAENAQELYRKITHALHGMRPRDFIMTVLKFLCNEIGVSGILAVSSECRQHNGAYFGTSHKEKVLVAYNEVWVEHGGVELANGFYDIPTTLHFKDMSEIPSRKRAVYRRRYDMLDKLESAIKSSCKRYASMTKGHNEVSLELP